MTSRFAVRKVLAVSGAIGLLALGPNACTSSDGDDDDGPDGTGTACDSDRDCRQFDLLCDPAASVCVECLTSNHCSDLEICSNGECVAITPCQSSRDCPTDEVCSESLSRCVECVQNADCAEGQVCADNACRAACASDKDCRQFDLLCATSAGYCVECTSDNHCPGGQRCSTGGTCVGSVSAPAGTGGRTASGEGGSAPAETGGAPASEGGAPGLGGDGAGGTPTATGGTEQGGTEQGGTEQGGSAPTGGKAATGGANHGGEDTGGRASTGGMSAAGGEGGAGAEQPFPPTAAACPILSSSSCLGCCTAVGVFALDRSDDSATELLVQSFDADGTGAVAEFQFTDFEQVGAIFFDLATTLDISSWNLRAEYSGGSIEVALSREEGGAGCVYEPAGATVGSSWTQVACWPEIWTAGPWDQIEVRLRSYDPGPGSLTVSGFEFL